MVGAGAVAGTIFGGDSNVSRSPVAHSGVMTDRSPATAVRTVSIRAETGDSDSAESNITTSNSTTSNITTMSRSVISSARAAPAPADEAPTAVVAMRFPSHWQHSTARAVTGNSDPSSPGQAMSFAAQPRPVEPVRPAIASAGGFQLASVDPAAEPEPAPTAMPKRMAKPAPKPAVLFNDAQLASIKARLRLTRDQELHWPKVEEALRAISWKIATEQKSKGIVRGGQAAMIDPSSPEVARLKSAAFPLIMSMREDQKQEVRQLAHTMGLKQVASMF
jgi:hypothetical protein